MTPVIMPQIGQDSPCGRIVEWYKHEGEPVAVGDLLLTVESDKAVFEVTAEQAGVLAKVLYPADTEVPILEPVGWVGAPDEALPENVSSATGAPSTSGAVAVETAEDEELDTTAAGAASGENELGSGSSDTDRPTLGTGECERSTATAADREVPFSRLRQRMADRLSMTQRDVPQFVLFDDIDMGWAETQRKKANEAGETHVTVTDWMVAAVAATLGDFPWLNAHVYPDRVVLKSRVDIGVATAVGDIDGSPDEAGVLVPVAANAAAKSVTELAAAIRTATTTARRGASGSAAEATFTVTSLGAQGISRFVPVINPPACAILALGAITPRLLPEAAGPQVRRMMTVTLVCDHRAVDGVYGARFLRALRARLEGRESQ